MRHGALGIIGGTLLVAGIALAVVSAVVGHSSATPQQVQLAPAEPGAGAPNDRGLAPGRGPGGLPFRPPDGNGFGGEQRPGIPFPAPGGSPPASR